MSVGSLLRSRETNAQITCELLQAQRRGANVVYYKDSPKEDVLQSELESCGVSTVG